jgi:hypothetical protein
MQWLTELGTRPSDDPSPVFRCSGLMFPRLGQVCKPLPMYNYNNIYNISVFIIFTYIFNLEYV